MKAAPTLKTLNETDDPRAFGGVLVDFCGSPKKPYGCHELWRFGESYANRSYTVSTIFRVLSYKHVIWNLDFRSYTWVSGWPDFPRVPIGDEKEAGR